MQIANKRSIILSEVNIVEDLRPIFQLLERKLGFLNAECCDTCCGQEISVIQSHILYEIHRRIIPPCRRWPVHWGWISAPLAVRSKPWWRKGL
ncbi:hypothetical protein CULT_40019 [[Clostridium] ultunense Esp]|nr:hypothetical protein CULT_40019 [[Clostridium] ultunense Esp]